GARRASDDGAQDAAERLRALPVADRPARARVHAGARRRRDPQVVAERRRREGADPPPAEAEHAGEDAVGGRLLPGRRRTAVEAAVARTAQRVERREAAAEI